MSIVGKVLCGLNREVVSLGRSIVWHCRDSGLNREVISLGRSIVWHCRDSGLNREVVFREGQY